MYGNGFYNPYMYNSAMNIGRTASLGKAGLGGLFKKFSLGGFLAGANKTLNVVNQAIPIYYQIKPMVANAKTMFKVMSAVKNTDNKGNSTSTSTNSINKTLNKKESNYTTSGAPTFFI